MYLCFEYVRIKRDAQDTLTLPFPIPRMAAVYRVLTRDTFRISLFREASLSPVHSCIRLLKYQTFKYQFSLILSLHLFLIIVTSYNYYRKDNVECTDIRSRNLSYLFILFVLLSSIAFKLIYR